MDRQAASKIAVTLGAVVRGRAVEPQPSRARRWSSTMDTEVCARHVEICQPRRGSGCARASIATAVSRTPRPEWAGPHDRSEPADLARAASPAGRFRLCNDW